MRKHLFSPVSILFFLFLFVFNTGCFKDKIRYTYQVSTPVLETLTQYRTAYKATAAQVLQTTGKINIRGNYIFLGELYKGIHVIDNSDPSHPSNIAFINLPGNQDFAIRGNTLYGDAYGDLALFDISDPRHIIFQKALANIFPDRSINYAYYSGNNPDSIMVIASWTTRDTTVDYNPGTGIPNFVSPCANCEFAFSALSAQPAKSSGTALAGSTARFAVIGDYLYTEGFSSVQAFNIANSSDPQQEGEFNVDTHIETIYPFGNKLFIGSNIGMYMYDVSASPANPVRLGTFTHARACDPVIADGKYAYVTLSDGTPCLGIEDQMDVVDITDLNNPSLVKTYPMTHPKGLSKDGQLLFVCDDKDGLNIYNAGDPNNIQLVKQFNNFSPADVIAFGGLAIVIASEGIFQYDYSDTSNIHLLSQIPVTN
jgi:hypothetical protein